jgi:hypothetical protein
MIQSRNFAAVLSAGLLVTLLGGVSSVNAQTNEELRAHISSENSSYSQRWRSLCPSNPAAPIMKASRASGY